MTLNLTDMDINEMADAAMGFAMYDSYRKIMDQNSATLQSSVPPPVKDWYAILNGTQAGPFTLGEMASMLKSGSVNAGTYVWKRGMEDWLPAESVPELKSVISPSQNESE